MTCSRITNALPIVILAVIAFGTAGCEYYQSPEGLTNRTISQATDAQKTDSASASDLEQQIQDLKDQLSAANDKSASDLEKQIQELRDQLAATGTDTDDAELKALEDKIAELEKQIEELKSQLSAEQTPVDDEETPPSTEPLPSYRERPQVGDESGGPGVQARVPPQQSSEGSTYTSRPSRNYERRPHYGWHQKYHPGHG